MSHPFKDYESSDLYMRQAVTSQTQPKLGKKTIRQTLDEELAFSIAEEERILACNLVPDGAIEKAEQEWDEHQVQQTARK
jgi:hypothetical protein